MNFKRILPLALLAMGCLNAVRPAAADPVLYDNLGNVGQEYHNAYSFAQPASFTLTSASTITGLNFGAWVSGSRPQLSWTISNQASGGTILRSGVVTPSMTYKNSLSLGYYVDLVSASITGVDLNAGTYWLTLNLSTAYEDDPDKWAASTNGGASLQLLGTVDTTPPNTGGTPNGGGSGLPSSVVPEPSSVSLLGLGLLGLFAAMKLGIGNKGKSAAFSKLA